MIINTEYFTSQEVRRIFRDKANRQDKLFVALALAKGVLNPRFMQSTPTAVLRISDKEVDAKYGTRMYGNSFLPKFRYKENLKLKRYIPEQQYNPLVKTKIDRSTQLDSGIPLALFTSNMLNDVVGLSERKEIAKYYYIHSLFYNSIAKSRKFKKTSLRIAEGLYAKSTYNFTPEKDGLLDLQEKGRVVVYDVLDSKGKNNAASAFEIATYWKDNFLFDEIILSFDTVDPSVDFSSQIIVILPEIDDSFRGRFERKIRTEFNYNIALNNGFAELTI